MQGQPNESTVCLISIQVMEGAPMGLLETANHLENTVSHLSCCVSK